VEAATRGKAGEAFLKSGKGKNKQPQRPEKGHVGRLDEGIGEGGKDHIKKQVGDTMAKQQGKKRGGRP